jgi:hypothetical protein
MRRSILLLLALLWSAGALALSLADLSQADAGGGLKDALGQGAQMAVKQLGRPGGFSEDKRVRIRLPGALDQAAQGMRMMGMGAQVDALEESMNRAAEKAVPQAQEILAGAITSMTLEDAKAILGGGKDSATRYLERSSRKKIRKRFLPIVKQATDQVGLAQQYNSFAGQAAKFGVVDADSAKVEGYVTERALDGLFLMIAEQEASIRKNPAAAASGLAKKVFGAL